MKNEKVLIVDFGSQYTQLIARRVRENKVYSEIITYSKNLNLDLTTVKGIILSGGPSSVKDTFDKKFLNVLINSNIPMLCICYGMQAVAKFYQSSVKSKKIREYGKADLRILKESNIFRGCNNNFQVWMSHGDSVIDVNSHFDVIASSGNNNISAIKHKTKELYGIQFHPEVTHTKDKGKIIKNFLINICKFRKTWNSKNIISDTISEIKSQIGKDRVILGLSGGVDSSVAAALINKAIGKNLICIFINNGLLRQNEENEVKQAFKKFKNLNIKYINAESLFLKRLKGVTNPEEKRKIVGKTFVDVFQKEAKKIKNVKWLGQGTIYPDIIESAGTSANAHLIKSHHNVGGLPKSLKLKLIEPLKSLFKDEVRIIGNELGLNKSLIMRHPFPGPGLSVRIMGEVKKQYADILRKADQIFINRLKESNQYYKISQAFAVFLPIKTVGVTGDGRSYEYVISLRAVETLDFMTANPVHFDNDFLSLISTEIINAIPEVARVCYDISSKPPATIEWE